MVWTVPLWRFPVFFPQFASLGQCRTPFRPTKALKKLMKKIWTGKAKTRDFLKWQREKVKGESVKRGKSSFAGFYEFTADALMDGGRSPQKAHSKKFQHK